MVVIVDVVVFVVVFAVVTVVVVVAVVVSSICDADVHRPVSGRPHQKGPITGWSVNSSRNRKDAMEKVSTAMGRGRGGTKVRKPKKETWDGEPQSAGKERSQGRWLMGQGREADRRNSVR